MIRQLINRGVSVSIGDIYDADSTLHSQPQLLAPQWLSPPYRALVRNVINHVTGDATGFHAHFIAYNVDSLTIRSVPLLASASSSVSPSQLAHRLLSGLDAFYHSLNNLIEKLHHSTWLYLLIDTNIFVTMSKYIYGFVLLMAPMVLTALRLVYQSQRHQQDTETQLAHALYIMLQVYGLGASSIIMARGCNQLGCWNASTGIVLLVTLSFVASFLFRSHCRLSAEDLDVAASVSLLPAGSSVSLLLCPYDWRLLKALVLLTTFILLSPLAILNFSAAIFMLLLLVPITLLVQPITEPSAAAALTTRCWYYLQKICHLSALLLFSPMSLLLIYCYYRHYNVLTAVTFLLSSLPVTPHLLYYLLPLAYLPVYLIHWMLWMTPLREVARAKDKVS